MESEPARARGPFRKRIGVRALRIVSSALRAWMGNLPGGRPRFEAGGARERWGSGPLPSAGDDSAGDEAALIKRYCRVQLPGRQPWRGSRAGTGTPLIMGNTEVQALPALRRPRPTGRAPDFYSGLRLGSIPPAGT